MGKKIVIVGGVAGGASAAARARRLDEHASIVIFEKGPDPSFANCGMPYFIGGEITDRSKLSVQTPASLKARLNLDVRVHTEVLSINRQAKTVQWKNLVSGDTGTEPYDALVLSMGAQPFKPPIPGIEREGNLTLRNLEDMDRIVERMKSIGAKTACVCGAGFIGVEMAEQLQHLGMDVSLVEALPQVMPPLDEEMAHRVQTELERGGVRVFVNNPVQAFEDPIQKENGSSKGSDVILKETDPETGKPRRIPADVVILGLGVRPDSKLASDAGLKVGGRGGVIVDSSMQTSDASIWAVGDAVEVQNPVLGGSYMVALAGPANRQGRIAADRICRMEATRDYPGTFGTSVVRAFKLTAACTGMNERTLKSAEKPYKAVHIHPNSHAGYYPGAAPVHFKLLFNPQDGKIWGAQAVGEDGVEKRIDVVATALKAGMTVDDLAELELCYAPPFGSAKDPVNFAGMVAQNMMNGLCDFVTWQEFMKEAEDPNAIVIDVRGAQEIKDAGGTPHPKAINIPVDSLREEIAKGRLEKERKEGKKIILTCATGQRGYYAYRILAQSGFENLTNLAGAWKTWVAHAKTLQAPV
uniref:Rhodanese domain-containing protein n=1 Tax=Chromera velia CCMP2878 TaxID=1169474 RepID=A0A0G4HQW4_9ALVE|eukprot:Cvel_7997.t1-p1 / transcript=Cvel_7997.t1 / gene=Cvel_7997 / organism=Chromera_velia_CCMP2878 / gene_product=Coenzyme A disulfide reductase, putative / transcript_product=Coenzyme A disulfide reductase, putative / location=Cvel_scaffold431:6817-11742(+) / protein_length=582 / sequence_SO=supercontig / SO=protein_coding / is_pseudo=false